MEINKLQSTSAISATGRIVGICISIFVVLAGFQDSDAQKQNRGGVEVNDAPRTVIVEPDNYPEETGKLNRVIADEIAVDSNSVFILKRDAVYWLDNTIINEGFTLHIEAEEGDGHPPIVRPSNLSGSSSHLFYTRDNAIFDGLFLVAIDEDGVAVRPLALQNSNKTLIFNNGWVVGTHDWSVSFFERGNSLFITNSVFANAGRVDHPDQGRFLETRGYDQDTIWVENTSMYNFKHAFLRNNGMITYLHLNHITGLNVSNNIRPQRTIDATITNNLFLNLYASGIPEDSEAGIIRGEWIGLAPVTDDERTFNISNNNIGYMDEEHLDALTYVRWQYHQAPVLDGMISGWMEMSSGAPKVIFENNIEEGVEFTDPPDPITPWTRGVWPDIEREMAYDHWNAASAASDPAPYHYTLDLIRDLSYSSGHASFRAAENGFPVGDLNWFPELKELWEMGESAPTDAVNWETPVTGFRLVGNYPNPFNPSTTIVFEMANKAEVVLDLYDMLGQQVMSMDLGVQTSGRHEIALDAGHLSSGMYMVRMQAGSQVQTRQISLIK